jgi:hypothetical protein
MNSSFNEVSDKDEKAPPNENQTNETKKSVAEKRIKWKSLCQA